MERIGSSIHSSTFPRRLDHHFDWIYDNMLLFALCKDCKTYKRCLKESQEWVRALLWDYLMAPPENDLTRFWRSILSGVPEIRSDLLENYFEQRFNLKQKEHNSTVLLKVFEDRRLFPYFYSKVIQVSLGKSAR